MKYKNLNLIIPVFLSLCFFSACSPEEKEVIVYRDKEDVIEQKDFLVFKNGIAQPIVDEDKFSADFDDETIHQAEGILRFCVYVETDYDTDGDGYLDLIKTYVQIPSAVFNNSSCKLGTIYQAAPYSSGLNTNDVNYSDYIADSTTYSSFEDFVTSTPAKSRPEVESVSTQDFARSARSSDWNYQETLTATVSKFVSQDGYVHNYGNYFLARGFAYVVAAGLGTYESQGLELCGTKYETEAFASVIKWIHGDAKAYTDLSASREIKASDWANGNVGMMGVSYVGTMAFAVATTGVEGLKCVIPEAGITSWYDYAYSQGAVINFLYDYQIRLSFACFTRLFDFDDFLTIKDRQAEAYKFYSDKLKEGKGAYNDFYAKLNYTLDYSKIKVPALIIAGLNDFNVSNKHTQNMFKAFKDAGQNESRLILHQDGHNLHTGLFVDDQLCIDIKNKWFSHYLYDVSNDVTSLPKVFVQHSYDQSWDTYNDLNWYQPAGNKVIDFKAGSQEGDYYDITCRSTYTFSDFTNDKVSSLQNLTSNEYFALYTAEAEEDYEIDGVVKVDLTLTTNVITENSMSNYPLCAYLVDQNAEKFWAYCTDNSYGIMYEEPVDENGVKQGNGDSDSPIYSLQMQKTNYKIITRGALNLSMEKSAFDNDSCREVNALSLGSNSKRKYTLYLNPSVYKMKKGHNLCLMIYPYDFDTGNNLKDPDDSSSSNTGTAVIPEYEYTVRIDSSNVKITIPTRK
ncbi:MAG: hypothetical protein K5873_06350 [Treponema sp.]|nr:hypothetical protein [Treponema sp.]